MKCSVLSSDHVYVIEAFLTSLATDKPEYEDEVESIKNSLPKTEFDANDLASLLNTRETLNPRPYVEHCITDLYRCLDEARE